MDKFSLEAEIDYQRERVNSVKATLKACEDAEAAARSLWEHFKAGCKYGGPDRWKEKLRVEAARLKRLEAAYTSLTNSTGEQSPALTAAEQQEKRRVKAEAEYDRCLRARREWLEKILNGRVFDHLTEEEQEQYRADEMMWNDRIQKARNELSKDL